MNTLGVPGVMPWSRPCREVTADLPACARTSGCVGLTKVRTGLAMRSRTVVMFPNLLEAASEDALPRCPCIPACSLLSPVVILRTPSTDHRPQTSLQTRVTTHPYMVSTHVAS